MVDDGTSEENPTLSGKKFQRRTFYRARAIDERRNPLALHYFAGKEEELRREHLRKANGSRGGWVEARGGTEPIFVSASPYHHRASTPAYPQTSSTPYWSENVLQAAQQARVPEPPPVRSPDGLSSARAAARRGYESFMLKALESLESLEIKGRLDAAPLKEATAGSKDGGLSEDDRQLQVRSAPTVAVAEEDDDEEWSESIESDEEDVYEIGFDGHISASVGH